jgi:hypothetical protein
VMVKGSLAYAQVPAKPINAEAIGALLRKSC